MSTEIAVEMKFYHCLDVLLRANSFSNTMTECRETVYVTSPSTNDIKTNKTRLEILIKIKKKIHFSQKMIWTDEAEFAKDI